MQDMLDWGAEIFDDVWALLTSPGHMEITLF